MGYKCLTFSLVGCRLDAWKHASYFSWSLCILHITYTKWVQCLLRTFFKLLKKTPGTLKATSTCPRPYGISRHLQWRHRCLNLPVGFCAVLSRFCWVWCNASFCFYWNWILMHPQASINQSVSQSAHSPCRCRHSYYEPVCCVVLGLAVLAKHWFVTSATQGSIRHTSQQGIGHLGQLVIQLDLAEKVLLFKGALRESEQWQGFCWEN